LRPKAFGLQHVFHLFGRRRAWFEPRKRVADDFAHPATDCICAVRVAIGLFLDHAFNHAVGERHAAGFDRVQINGREQVSAYIIDCSKVLSRCSTQCVRWAFRFAQIAHGRNGLGGDVDHATFANRDNGFAGVVDRVDFTRFLRNGRNVFAIHAVDGGWDDPRDRLNESVLFDATLAPVSGLQGDFNNDRCVDRADLLDALPGFRGLQMPPVHQALDLNGDGAINIADARFLVTLFSRPRGQSCFP